MPSLFVVNSYEKNIWYTVLELQKMFVIPDDYVCVFLL